MYNYASAVLHSENSKKAITLNVRQNHVNIKIRSHKSVKNVVKANFLRLHRSHVGPESGVDTHLRVVYRSPISAPTKNIILLKFIFCEQKASNHKRV